VAPTNVANRHAASQTAIFRLTYLCTHAVAEEKMGPASTRCFDHSRQRVLLRRPNLAHRHLVLSGPGISLQRRVAIPVVVATIASTLHGPQVTASLPAMSALGLALLENIDCSDQPPDSLVAIDGDTVRGDCIAVADVHHRSFTLFR